MAPAFASEDIGLHGTGGARDPGEGSEGSDAGNSGLTDSAVPRLKELVAN